jgi:hypothetical protein
MAGIRPHQITHEHKWQSRGMFEPRDSCKRSSIFSDVSSTTLLGSSRASSDSGVKTPKKLKGKGEKGIWDDKDLIPPYFKPPLKPEKPGKKRRIWPWIVLAIIPVLVVGIILVAVLHKE